MSQTFQPVRVVRQFHHTVGASPAALFPLLCPVREHEWIDGWKCQLVYSESGVAESNCVFTTHFPGLLPASWIVSRYEPARFIIEFVIAHETAALEKLDLALAAHASGGAEVRWRRTYTGLTPEGNEFIQKFSGEYLDRRMGELMKALAHFAENGEMLRRVPEDMPAQREGKP